ncbi:putative protein TPRXL isoform X2 [Varroa jacobsoni]|uniref:EGF-like domain-containing protein n=1 Tax=Varroa destructor TaxID=109461 RepID=A0A7M7KZC0_VARDE|nr:putative protein TPRXL isoform X2 [Varroa destructor]XP_022697337.1 putative protein TPRXL isoform X2 [Varroa jacobsoni]
MSPCVSCGLPFDSSPCDGGEESSSSMCECCHRLGQCSCSDSSSRCYVSCERPRASMDTRTDTRSAPNLTNVPFTSTTPSSSLSTLPPSTATTLLTPPAPASRAGTTKMTVIKETTNSFVPNSSHSRTSRTTSCACQASGSLWRTRSRPMSTLQLVSWIALIALVSSADACSTRSTPKARSSYISQLQAQQQAQRPIPRLVPHAPQQPSSYRAQPPASSVPVQTPFAAVPAPSVPTVSDTDLTTQRPNVTFQTYTCPEAYAKWYCLNGASCFSLKIGESILYNCECASGYVGQRCEFKDLDARRGVLIETATVSIAAGVVSIMLVATLCCVVLYLVIVQRCFQVKKGQYIYENWNPVLRTKQAVPVAVLSADGLVRTV